MNGNDGLSSMDLWRLSSDYSVVDAAILITGNDPALNFEERWRRVESKSKGFEAAYTSLRNSILTNKIPAQLVYGTEKEIYGDELYVSIANKETVETLRGSMSYIKSSGWEKRDFRILLYPDWNNTLISKDNLKEFCSSMGIYPRFLFPKGREEGVMDKENERYSKKLACALAAWNNYDPSRYRVSSIKEGIKKWVKANAVTYDLLNESGDVPNDVVEQIATIVNWNTKGGAPKTGGAVSETSPQVPREPPQNYERVSPKDLMNGREPDLEDDLPF